MKQIIIMILVIKSLVIAEQYNPYESTYKKMSGVSKEKLKMLMNDTNYKEASSYMYDSIKMKNKKISGRDPENIKDATTFKTVKVPNFETALRYYEKSVESTGNPLSAYSGIYIIDKFVGKHNFNYVKKYKKFAKALYQDENRICQAYVAYGSVFEKGLDNRKNIRKAIDIYRKGEKDKKCNNSWEMNIFASKVWTLNRQIKKD